MQDNGSFWFKTKEGHHFGKIIDLRTIIAGRGDKKAAICIENHHGFALIEYKRIGETQGNRSQVLFFATRTPFCGFRLLLSAENRQQIRNRWF